MSDSQEESVRLYRAMGFGHTPSLITKCLHYAMSVSLIIALHNNQCLPIGYSVIVAITGLPIGYSVIVALTGLPIGYSVIVALTGLPIGYSVIVALTGLPIGYGVIVALTDLPIRRIQCNSSILTG